MSSLRSRIYMDAQKNCGLEVGDWVKVVAKVAEDASEWGGWCSANMDKTVGMIGKITRIEQYGINVFFKELAGRIFCYPYFVLEKTEQPCPFKVGDCVRVVGKGSMNQDIEKIGTPEATAPWWNPNMDKTMGMVGKVSRLPDKNEYQNTVCVSFESIDRLWNYTWDCLEKVDNPEYEFKPFERVLVRDKEHFPWHPDIFLWKDGETLYGYKCCRGSYQYCIPYKGNEYLLGTTNSPKN